jgi:hypothetical protein
MSSPPSNENPASSPGPANLGDHEPLVADENVDDNDSAYGVGRSNDTGQTFICCDAGTD